MSCLLTMKLTPIPQALYKLQNIPSSPNLPFRMFYNVFFVFSCDILSILGSGITNLYDLSSHAGEPCTALAF